MFWNMHKECHNFVLYKLNAYYLILKLMRNKQHDIQKIKQLESKWWRIIEVWE